MDQHVTFENLSKLEIKEYICIFDKKLNKQLKDDNFIWQKEKHWSSYEDVGLELHENDNINFLRSNVNEVDGNDNNDDAYYFQLNCYSQMKQYMGLFVGSSQAC